MTKMGISNATDLSNIFKWYEIFRSWLYYREGNATYYKQGRADRSLFLVPLGKFIWKNVVNYRPQGIHTPSKTRRQGSYKQNEM